MLRLVCDWKPIENSALQHYLKMVRITLILHLFKPRHLHDASQQK